jgi:hypothetical protein
VQKKANERLRELEHPVIDALARILEPPNPKDPHAAALRIGSAVVCILKS